MTNRGERARVRGLFQGFNLKRDPSSALPPPSPLTKVEKGQGEFSEFTVANCGFVARLESAECLISHRAKNNLCKSLDASPSWFAEVSERIFRGLAAVCKLSAQNPTKLDSN